MSSASTNTIDFNKLRESVIQQYRYADGTRPDVMHVRIDDKDYVIKDYNPTSGWFGKLAGPILVKREIKALQKLQGITGIPDLFPCSNNKVLITSYCDTQSAARLTRPLNWLKFEEELSSLIKAMHLRGVAHCDLRGPGNILINENDSPYLVDYVACVFQGAKWNKLWNYIFSKACSADESAVLKLKKKIAAEHLTVNETKMANDSSSNGRVFRKTSRALRQFARFIFVARKK